MSAMHQPVDHTPVLISMLQSTRIVALDKTLFACRHAASKEMVGWMQDIARLITAALYKVKPCVQP